LRAQIAELADAIKARTVTLVDVGGDIIARGDEPELLSPLADSMTLAAVNGLALPTQVVVAGPGLDGELDEATVWQRCTQAGSSIRKLRTSDVKPYLSALSRHPSEATALLAAAALGVGGQTEIRDKGALVPVGAHSSAMHVIDTANVIKVNTTAAGLMKTRSLEEAEATLSQHRRSSELIYERRKAHCKKDSTELVDHADAVSRYGQYREQSIKRGIQILTFRRIAETIGLNTFNVDYIRSLVCDDAHQHLSLCVVR
jgi:hypothetical protein